MARFLYSLTLAILSPVIVCYLFFIRAKNNHAYRTHFSERFAFKIKHLAKNAFIFHCASVGEVSAASPLIRAYRKRHPNEAVIITCNTPTGREYALQLFNGEIEVCYLPFDFFFTAKRFINTLRPKALAILETELWPNLFAHSQKAQCPVFVLNARLSDKSFKGYQRFASLTKNIMQNITMLASHDNEDAKRFLMLGLDSKKISVTGSIKFDISISENEREEINTLKKQFDNRLVWIAGSTHPSEHEQVLLAHKKILSVHPSALLIIAPRHPEQFEEVAHLISEHHFTYSRRTGAFIPEHQVLLADTLGELKLLYGTASIAFVGGSLINRGGHNPLEAAALSVGVITGPNTYNFNHIYPQLIANNGAIVVNDAEQLAEKIISLFNNPQHLEELGDNAFTCLQNSQGAINKTLTLLNKRSGA